MDGDDEERQLRVTLMRADLDLKRKQSFWETPRNIALLLTAVAGVAGFLGFKLGSQPQQITVHLDSPLIVQPPAK